MKLSWWRRGPRRGVLPASPRAPALTTGSTVVRVWLGLAYLGICGWLVAGGPSAVPVTWTEGMIAPRYVYAPVDCTYQVDVREPNGRSSLRTISVQRSELIVAKGQRLTAEQVGALQAIAARIGEPSQVLETAALWFLALLVGGCGFTVLRFATPAVAFRTSHLALVGLLSVLTLGLAHGVLHYSTLPATATPVAGMSMLLTLLLNPTTAVIATVVMSLLVGVMVHQHLSVALVMVFGGVAGIVAVRGARRRGHLIRAGAWSGLVQGLVIVAVSLLEHRSWQEAAWEGVVGGALSGTAAFVVTIALLPILENLFGVITNVTLLELSDLNHPLLKELSLKAPGTYHHSLVVSTLAEAGCEAIGANGLLARVGCYFHDIGKMPKADYFVENQPPGQSRHDKLAPSMSSLIIVNHVKEGIELAKAHKLNQAIIDFIPGHHGTGLIYFFYRRALEQVEDESLLKEEQYRYPGPRPRTRETAAGMLADSVEAACRALPQRTPAKLMGAVRRIINNKFIDGQLDECDLTLRDLERIADAFVRVLSGIYHSRVPYPMPPGEDVEDSELDTGADSGSPAGPGASRARPATGRADAAPSESC